jgi:hypothetical protein
VQNGTLFEAKRQELTSHSVLIRNLNEPEKHYAVLPLRRRDSDSIKKKSLFSRQLGEPSVRSGASPTSATTMRWRLAMN